VPDELHFYDRSRKVKIAVITDDERTISQHFGRAPYYLVATVAEGQVIDWQRRDKLGHAHFSNEPHAHQPGEQHGFDPASQDRHTRMAQTIADCDILICGGMGAGAYASMQARDIKPVVTDILSIDEAVQAYLAGHLVDQVERLH
jgi:predicted Fe-Mo cluster-binding NifX family protein